MKGYDGMHWFGYVILICVYSVAILGAYFIFGSIGLWIGAFIAILNIIYVILWDIETRKTDPINDPINKQDESYFTDEDFIYAKVGEWVSRP